MQSSVVKRSIVRSGERRWNAVAIAVERALKAADADPAIPKDRVARLNLLRRGGLLSAKVAGK